jgi:hypothetical protein
VPSPPQRDPDHYRDDRLHMHKWLATGSEMHGTAAAAHRTEPPPPPQQQQQPPAAEHDPLRQILDTEN